MNQIDTNQTLEQLKQKYTYVHQQAVAWGDMDAFGHVNNVNFYRYMENARIEYMNMLDVINDKMYIVIYSSSCQYMSPVKYPDTLYIGTQITEMRNSSFTMTYEMYSQTQQTLVAKAETVIVTIDRLTHNKMVMPQELKDKIISLKK